MSFCCFKCFRHPYLRRYILKNGKKGDCKYCGEVSVRGVPPRNLRELFEPVVECYEPVEQDVHYSAHGIRDACDFESLSYLLDEDWQVFSEYLDATGRDRLMDDIWICPGREADGHYDTPPSEPWAHKDDRIWDVSPEQMWRWFAEAAKDEQWDDIDSDEAGELVHPQKWIGFSIRHRNAVKVITPRTVLYRGRAGHTKLSFSEAIPAPWPPEEMHAPPAHLAKHYRVNREGVSVFYCAGDIETALHESGREPGTLVSLRRVAAKRRLKLADLTKFHGVAQPFGVRNFASIERHARLLQQLNIVLSSPVNEADTKREYIPTQVLADAIQEEGFDGLCFRSSKHHGGINIVVFNPDDMRVLSTSTEACVRTVPPNLERLMMEAMAGC
jgi:hypothetical protein